MRNAAFYLKIISINLLVFVLILLFLEIFARVFFPEFIGNIHSSNITLGKKVHGFKYLGQNIRVPYSGYQPAPGKNHIIILGDSITGGYGHAYEDIYWVNLQRMLDLIFKNNAFQIAAYGDPGQNIQNILSAFKKIAANDIKVNTVIYQFNFNDIMPYTAQDLKVQALKNDNQNISVFKKIWARFNVARLKYLNHSAAIRMLWHYAEIMRRKTSGSCMERGTDALESYTWTFGSEKFAEQSNALWADFEKSLKEIKTISEKLNARFYILISPTIFDIDSKNKHPHYNHINIDFSCATIEPLKKLTEISEKYNIELINPIEYMKTGFENRIKEGNFQSFYFTADHNHFNETGSKYMSEYILSRLLSDRLKDQ
jgi:hypothetical protein